MYMWRQVSQIDHNVDVSMAVPPFFRSQFFFFLISATVGVTHLQGSPELRGTGAQTVAPQIVITTLANQAIKRYTQSRIHGK